MTTQTGSEWGKVDAMVKKKAQKMDAALKASVEKAIRKADEEEEEAEREAFEEEEEEEELQAFEEEEERAAFEEEAECSEDRAFERTQSYLVQLKQQGEEAQRGPIEVQSDIFCEEPPQLITVARLAKLLKFSVGTPYAFIREGCPYVQGEGMDKTARGMGMHIYLCYLPDKKYFDLTRLLPWLVNRMDVLHTRETHKKSKRESKVIIAKTIDRLRLSIDAITDYLVESGVRAAWETRRCTDAEVWAEKVIAKSENAKAIVKATKHIKAVLKEKARAKGKAMKKTKKVTKTKLNPPSTPYLVSKSLNKAADRLGQRREAIIEAALWHFSCRDPAEQYEVVAQWLTRNLIQPEPHKAANVSGPDSTVVQ